MEYNLKNYPQDGKWMSAYRWKERFEKELRAKLRSNRPYGLSPMTKELIKEILGNEVQLEKQT